MAATPPCPAEVCAGREEGGSPVEVPAKAGETKKSGSRPADWENSGRGIGYIYITFKG